MNSHPKNENGENLGETVVNAEGTRTMKRLLTTSGVEGGEGGEEKRKQKRCQENGAKGEHSRENK